MTVNLVCSNCEELDEDNVRIRGNMELSNRLFASNNGRHQQQEYRCPACGQFITIAIEFTKDEWQKLGKESIKNE